MTLLTVGYGNRGMPRFLDLLGDHQITHLVDVRTTPYSRYHLEFGRESLKTSVETAGFRYVYMGDSLGGAASRARSESYENGLQLLYRKLQGEPKWRLALMCGCLRAESCHRGQVVAEDLTSMGVEVQHIDEHDRLIDQAELRGRLSPRQFELTL